MSTIDILADRLLNVINEFNLIKKDFVQTLGDGRCLIGMPANHPVARLAIEHTQVSVTVQRGNNKVHRITHMYGIDTDCDRDTSGMVVVGVGDEHLDCVDCMSGW